MGTSVTYCTKCRACNWAGKDKCYVCSGELEPTFREVYNYYYQNDPEFRKMVDNNNQSKAEGR